MNCCSANSIGWEVETCATSILLYSMSRLVCINRAELNFLIIRHFELLLFMRITVVLRSEY